MQLNFNEISLLRYVLATTGEKEIGRNNEGKEVEMDAPRRLNGEDSAQRRHFFKNTQEFIDEIQNNLRVSGDEYRKDLEDEETKLKASEVEKAGEKEEDYNDRIKKLATSNLSEKLVEKNKKFSETLIVKQEIEVTDKTKEVLKKYFKEFGDKIGFMSNDDEVVESINNLLS